ncbi:unnamed protein product [Cylicocyclus nassatus]|uniref:Uncharacterized protein n=1 Tax=Cylicocyclus nassatus TaxID=53992 RepID=A0AA36DJI1_CYLNA|nr:unnamed protein product [Cylicocyclus nassatus]
MNAPLYNPQCCELWTISTLLSILIYLKIVDLLVFAKSLCDILPHFCSSDAYGCLKHSKRCKFFLTKI